MASWSDFRRVADDVRNWGRWGDADELGTLNLITAEKVQQAASLVRHGKVFPLGVDFGSSGPQGAFHFRQNPLHVMTIDGGDASTLAEYGPAWTKNPAATQLSEYWTNGPMRFNDDVIIMPLQAATQWDALSHVYYEDKLYNGFPAEFGDEPRRVSTAASTRWTARASRHAACCSTSCACAVWRPSANSATRSPRPNSTRRRAPRASPWSAATSCWSGPVGGQGFCRPATAPSPARAWTGRARRGCTTTRSPRSPPTT